MTFWRTFDTEFYSGTVGSAASSAATTKYDITLDGHGYMLDLQNTQQPYGFETVPLLHKFYLQDRGTILGENSLNPEDYWRRSYDTWTAGTGQEFLDHDQSVSTRFRQSKGIDPFNPSFLQLLHDTASRRSSANTNLALGVAGSYLYLLDGDHLYYTQDMTVNSPTFTEVTHAVADAALSGAVSMSTDGYTVYVADGTRVHYTTRGGSTFTKFHTSDHVCTLFAATKSRLFSANGNVLYYHTGTAGSATAVSYFTHPNSDWVWTAIVGGSNSVYFAGYSGDKSAIYSATLKSDGTVLDVPVIVATIPTGEICRALYSYLDILMVGTDKGLRAAQTNSNGAVVLGRLIPMTSPPKCFESQDRFVWFGWTNYDTSSSGLGRVDLSTFNDDVPAYSSDLMATAQGTVLSVVTFQSNRIFAVSGSGFYAETTNKVPTGTIYSGWLNYSLADPKLALKVDVSHRSGAGTYTIAVAADENGTYTQCGNSVITSAAVGNNETVSVPQIQGRRFETLFTINRSGTDTTDGPRIDRWTLMVEPQPERRLKIMVPIFLHSRMKNRLGQDLSVSPSAERAHIASLWQSRSIVTYQDFEENYSVIVNDFHWVPYNLVGNQRSWDGTLHVELKVIN